MSDELTALWNAHLASVVRAAAEDTERILQAGTLEQRATEARLRRQIAEDRARTEFLELTRAELALFRAWLADRGRDWPVEVER